MRPKTSSRAFAALAAGGLVVEGVAAWLAYAWTARSLPCTFEPARAFFGPSTACPVPVALVGHDTYLPAAICGALVVASAVLFLASFTGTAVATLRAKRSCARRRAPYPWPATAISAWSERPPKWLMVVPEDDPDAYCLGLFRPWVVVSSGLLQRLGEPALKAVLEHEASHRRRRDPLRYAVGKSLARGLFFVPLLVDLAEATLAENEASADARAVGFAGRRAVVTAMLETVAHPSAPAGSAGMATEEFLRLRIDALESGKRPRVRLRPARLVASGLGLALLLGAGVWLASSPHPRVVMLQPHLVHSMPMGTRKTPLKP